MLLTTYTTGPSKQYPDIPLTAAIGAGYHLVYIYNLGTLFVCLFVQDNLSHLKSDYHDILAQYVFWANLKHYEVGFFNFDFFRGARLPYTLSVKISTSVVRNNLRHLKS